MKNLLLRATTMVIVMISSQHFYAMENSKDILTNRFGTHEFSVSIGTIIMALEEKNAELQSIQSNSDARENKRAIKKIQERHDAYLQIADSKLCEALHAALDCFNDHKVALAEIAHLQNHEAESQES